MPAIFDDESDQASTPSALPFPPITKSHILHCSYHYWHPKYRTITPKARLVPLTRPFIDYLRSDGIILPSDDHETHEWSDDSGIYSASDNPDASDEEEEPEDVAAEWRDVHETIRDTIAELGGKVMPKLNWSAPKDATWMNANTMECRTPQDIYLLLKSSDFVTHDLEHALEDCIDDTPEPSITTEDIPFHLALRKSVPNFNPSVEFRCFVRGRKLLSICQRDLNHFDFLFKMQSRLRSLIQEFFDVRLRDTFPDENFVFDVYVPQPYDRVWLVDFNPWAPRTDPLLFSWLELLTMSDLPEMPEFDETQFVRLSLNGPVPEDVRRQVQEAEQVDDNEDDDIESDEESDEEADEELWLPELRLVRKSDPEAWNFSTPRYSAHKLPKDVVDASQNGEGLREFARDWQKILELRQREDAAAESSEDD